MDFAVPADHGVKKTKKNKKKQSEMIVKYLDFTRKLKKLLDMRVKVVLIVVGALRIVSKSLEKRLKDRKPRLPHSWDWQEYSK